MNGFIACAVIVGAFFGTLGNASETDILSERPLINFQLVPELPKVGERVSIMMQVATDFQKNEVHLEATLNAVPVKLDQSGLKLWAAGFRPFTEIKTHQLNVDIFLRDQKEATRIREATQVLRVEINRLNRAISEETDPDRVIQLSAERDRKVVYLDRLEVELDELKVLLKSESISFKVEGDPSNVEFPVISSVVPNVVTTGRRVNITLSGQNFPANPVVKFGGQNGTLISATATEIVVLGPNFSVPGMKDIEVRFPASGGDPLKNAFFTSSFFATEQVILKNLRPTAVTTGYIRGVWPITAPVQLNASLSYDENGDQFDYQWKFLASPPGSVFPSGTTLPNVAQPEFTPDKIGVYRIQLRLQEVGTTEEFLSFSNITTVEVK